MDANENNSLFASIRVHSRVQLLRLAIVPGWGIVPGPMASAESNKVIYSMTGVSKRYEKKVILENIFLSYFYGAKIGVLGLNGSGKSSLLKILAGGGKDF